MLITVALVEAFQVCLTKAYWRAHGKPTSSNPETDWHTEQRKVYREHGMRKLIRECHSEDVFTGTLDRDALITGNWRWGQGCQVSSDSLESVLEAVEVSREKRLRLTPIRFVAAREIARTCKLLLAFDGMVLSQALGEPVSTGRLILGMQYAIQSVALPPLTRALRGVIADLMVSLRGSTEPRPLLGRQCPTCEYFPECHRLAMEADDLSLLPGMTIKERKAWGDRGIFTVTQLSYTFRPRRRPERLADRPEKYRHALKALAIREKKIHVVGQPELRVQDTPVYLDVEGHPHQDVYFLIGAQVMTPAGPVQHSFWADSDADESQIWTEFLGLLTTLPKPRLLHYGSFETTFLRRMIAQHGMPENPTIAEALNNPVNILSILYGHIYFPTYANGLKDHARFLGFEWTEAGAGGLDALRWRAMWERTKDPVFKQKLIPYNADDCEALYRVSRFIRALSGNEPPVPEVVQADALPRSRFHKWAQVNFQMPELEAINRAAYWHYQRNPLRIVRDSARSRTLTRRRLHRMPIDRKVAWPGLLMCPKCGRVRLYRNAVEHKTVVDVRFCRSGLRRSVIKYIFDRQRCPNCRAVFSNPDRPWDRGKFGNNLRSLIIYQAIDLGMSLSSIGRFLKDILRLDVSRSAVHRSKALAAEYYAATYRGIWDALVAGKVIHADETQVNLETGTGYVWVFTNVDEVAYVYAPTREAKFVQSLLKDFKGVLVSDFYTGYESLGCPQQRCLIHLIRDLNDDVLREPFNEEMRGLVAEFAGLLRPAIATIDRFGLKARYLRKHSLQAERFFDRLGRRAYQTDLAQKGQRRLLKNRQTLFAFCKYDGISWHNNHAEHAIKALVALRRHLSGISSEKGMQEYLTLLSLCETCRYSGVSFLEFLRSDERDVVAFAKGRRKNRQHEGSADNVRSVLMEH